MTGENNIHDQLDRYYSGELNETERLEIEQRIQSEPEWRKAAAVHQQLTGFLSETDVLELRMELEEVAKEMIGGQKPMEESAQGGRWRWGIAASILAIIVFSWWWMQREPSAAALFAEYYSPYLGYHQQRGADGEAALTEAFRAYEAGNYAEAIQEFKQVTVAEDELMVWFYLAQAELAHGNASEARKGFDTVINQGDNFYIAQAEWYICLAHLQMGDLDAARAALDQILLADAHPYLETAIKLRADLPNP